MRGISQAFFFSKVTPNENQVDSSPLLPPTQLNQQYSSPPSTNTPSQNEDLDLPKDDKDYIRRF